MRHVGRARIGGESDSPRPSRLRMERPARAGREPRHAGSYAPLTVNRFRRVPVYTRSWAGLRRGEDAFPVPTLSLSNRLARRTDPTAFGLQNFESLSAVRIGHGLVLWHEPGSARYHRLLSNRGVLSFGCVRLDGPRTCFLRAESKVERHFVWMDRCGPTYTDWLAPSLLAARGSHRRAAFVRRGGRSFPPV